jgi:hypothetical protein
VEFRAASLLQQGAHGGGEGGLFVVSARTYKRNQYHQGRLDAGIWLILLLLFLQKQSLVGKLRGKCRECRDIESRDDDVFYLFLQKQKIGSKLHIYL